MKNKIALSLLLLFSSHISLFSTTVFIENLCQHDIVFKESGKEILSVQSKDQEEKRIELNPDIPVEINIPDLSYTGFGPFKILVCDGIYTAKVVLSGTFNLVGKNWLLEKILDVDACKQLKITFGPSGYPDLENVTLINNQLSPIEEEER